VLGVRELRFVIDISEGHSLKDATENPMPFAFGAGRVSATPGNLNGLGTRTNERLADDKKKTNNVMLSYDLANNWSNSLVGHPGESQGIL